MELADAVLSARWAGAAPELQLPTARTRLGIADGALIVEEFAAADPGIAGYFNHAMKDVHQVLRLATPEQRETFLKAYLSDDRYLTAHASTEPTHGADR